MQKMETEDELVAISFVVIKEVMSIKNASQCSFVAMCCF